MKKLLATILLIAFFLTGFSKAIILPKDAAGGAYRPALDLNGVDTIIFKGRYKNVDLAYYGIWGTANKKILLKSDPVDSAIISGYYPYCMLITGAHFILEGLHFSGFDTTYSASGLALFESSNIEVRHCTFTQLQAGILQNPIAAKDMGNNYFHDLTFANFRNPKDGGRGECFYLGNTKSLSPGKFRNCRIENIIINDITGDGIQLCQGTDFTLNNIRITNWGQAQLKEQRYGILIGNDANAFISNVVLDGGHGQAFQFLGGGKNSFKNVTIKNVNLSNLDGEDIVYIRARGNGFSMDFSLNSFINVTTTRNVITNATPDSLTTGSIFCGNVGVSAAQVSLNKKDRWGCMVLPLPEPTPEPEPRPKPHKKYLRVEFYDGNGWKLFTKKNISGQEAEIMIRDSHYANGVYYIVFADKEAFTKKLIKIK